MTEPLAGSHGDTPADDAPLKKWAEYYLGLGLKPIPKRINEKAPAIRWKHWTKDYPRQADLDQWFDQDGVDGICLVLDGTDTVIIDCDGPRDRCLDLLAASDINIPGSSHKCVHDSAPAGRPRRGKRVRMRSCQLTSGEVVCRSVDGRLRGPRF